MRPKMAKMRPKMAKMRPEMAKLRLKMAKMRPKMGPNMAKMRPNIAEMAKMESRWPRRRQRCRPNHRIIGAPHPHIPSASSAYPVDFGAEEGPSGVQDGSKLSQDCR